MQEKDFCKCKKIEKVTSSFDDWYEFDICWKNYRR